jgi:hypothetical protein
MFSTTLSPACVNRKGFPAAAAAVAAKAATAAGARQAMVFDDLGRPVVTPLTAQALPKLASGMASRMGNGLGMKSVAAVPEALPTPTGLYALSAVDIDGVDTSFGHGLNQSTEVIFFISTSSR